MHSIKSILFVCTGNSCRSIMAEGLLKKALKEAGGSHIEVGSAGVIGVDGLSPTNETIEVMKVEGVDVSGYKSKKLTDDMIKNSDLILVMEETHRLEVVDRVPGANTKTHLLKGFGLDEKAHLPEGFSIPDPMGRPIKDYEQCFNMIKKEIERIIKIL